MCEGGYLALSWHGGFGCMGVDRALGASFGS